MTARTKETALETFIERKAEFDALLERLADFSEDHFNVDPEGVTWGDVGTLAEWITLLRRIADAAFKEGEHAR